MTSPTPGFSRIAQLCGEATAASARDDAAQLSAERRLQVAHQFVVDDAARGDTEVAVGTNDEHGRVRGIVVAREVTLLPRHWDWLNGQPGGASVALRKLVEEARRVNEGPDRIRRSQESAYRFMSAMAGNLPGFEEATRALFARNPDRFDGLIRGWPKDVRTHLARMVQEWMRTEATNS